MSKVIKNQFQPLQKFKKPILQNCLLTRRMPRRRARKLKLMSSFFCLDGAVCLAPCCRRVNGRQEINLAKHTPRPGTSAVPASPGLQEIFILNGNRERRCPYTTSNVVSTDEERFLVSMRIRSEFYQHAAGERLGAEARPLAVANPRKGSFYRSEAVQHFYWRLCP